MTSNDRQLARALVGGQFLLLGLWAVTGHALAAAPWARGVQAAGVILACWAFAVMTIAQRRLFRISPDPTGHSTLVRSGPYRWIRHPMYTSILVVVGASAADWGAGTGWMLFAALAAVLWSKLNFEERLLLEAFPDYAAYRTQSWRLIPPLY